MAERSIRIHAFASVKGGVGKSSLAIACAKLLVEQAGRKPVLVDGDMMGTSIADGLDLCAPKVALTKDGKLDLLAPPTGEHYSLEETRRLRGMRRDGTRDGGPLPPVFLNDILEYFDERFAEGTAVTIDAPRVDALLWHHEQDDGIAYLPSSALRRDVAESLGWIGVQEQGRFDDWVHCLAWTFEALLRNRQDITDIVVDLPPGTVGLTHQMLVLLSYLEGKQLPSGYPAWNGGAVQRTSNPFLVSSDDRNDLLPALEYVGRYRQKLRPLRLLVNRVQVGTDIEKLKESARQMLGPALAGLGIEKDMQKVDEYRETLGLLFKMGDLRVDEKVRGLMDVLRIERGVR